MRSGLILFLTVVLFGFMSVSAQQATPTPTFEPVATQGGTLVNDAPPLLTPFLIAAPEIEIREAEPEATDEPSAVSVGVTINEAPDAVPTNAVPVEPTLPSVPADTVHIALVVGGIVALAIIGVAAFLLKTTGEQLYNSLPAIAQYGVRAGGEYLLHEAAKTPQADDDAAIESALKALGFVVVREDDGSITLRRPSPVVQGPMPIVTAQTMTAAPTTTVTFTPPAPTLTEADVRRIVEERYMLGTPVTTPGGSPLYTAPSAADAERIARERQQAGANAVAEGYDANSEAAG